MKFLSAVLFSPTILWNTVLALVLPRKMFAKWYRPSTESERATEQTIKNAYRKAAYNIFRRL